MAGESDNHSCAYTVRVATRADADAVDALLQASYPVMMAPAYRAGDLAAAVELLTKSNDKLLAGETYYVAESEGTLIGCGGWTPERPGTGIVEVGIGHVRHFATHPAWTRRGIGRAIHHRCEEDARSAGIVRFECYSSLNAEPFYAALGFRRVRDIALQLRPGVELPAVLMRRRLVLPVGPPFRHSR